MFLLACALACAGGCGSTRTVYVKPGDPVQLRQPIEADVWVYDKDGKQVPSRTTIPEGWWALDDPGEPDE